MAGTPAQDVPDRHMLHPSLGFAPPFVLLLGQRGSSGHTLALAGPNPGAHWKAALCLGTPQLGVFSPWKSLPAPLSDCPDSLIPSMPGHPSGDTQGTCQGTPTCPTVLKHPPSSPINAHAWFSVADTTPGTENINGC